MTIPSTIPIGTTIYVPSLVRQEHMLPCPDCKGEHVWIISTPGGMRTEIACPRCKGGGKAYEFLRPTTYVRTMEIKESTISEARIRQKRDHQDAAKVHTWVDYDTAPYAGTLRPEHVFLTRAEAEVAGAAMIAADEAKENTQRAEDEARNKARAGIDIVQVLQSRADEKRSKLEAKIERLRDAMMDAIKFPYTSGPKKTSKSYGGDEITPQNMAEWLNKMLDEADLETFSEDEIHEATCHC